jgi:hypothetical protein
MKYMYFITIFLFILPPAAAPAEMPEGASDPAFQEAVEIWLSDDDAASLPVFAKLAQEGNIAAQILLGQIEWERILLSPWVATLGLNERRAIFIGPGGRFGRSWLWVAAERSDFAEIFRAAQDFREMQAVVPELYELGESRATNRIIGLLWVAGEWDALVELESQGVLPPEFLWAAWNAAMKIQEKGPSDEVVGRMHDFAATVGETDPELAAQLELSIERLAELEPGTPESIRSMRELAFQDFLNFASYTADRIRESDVGKQVAAVCRALCPSQTESCTTAANPTHVLGGFPINVTLGSPAATIIPTERYVNSQRAIGELLRKHAWFLQSSNRQDEYIQKLADESQCLADHVKAAMSR